MAFYWRAFAVGANQGLVTWAGIQYHERWWAMLGLIILTGLNFSTLSLILDTRRLKTRDIRDWQDPYPVKPCRECRMMGEHKMDCSRPKP